VEGLHQLAKVAAEKILDLGAPTGFLEVAAPKRIFKIIKPDSQRRLTFEVISVFVLMFDVIYTPYSLTWDKVVDESVGLPIVMCSTGFWVVDLLLSFVTGFHTSEGHVEMRFKKIVPRYLRSWFLIDFSCVAGDLVNIFPVLFLGSSGGQAGTLSRILRVAKLARFLRVLGMVRMLRVMNAMNNFMEAQLSEAWRMMVRILQISASLIWLGHLCACGWYAVGIGMPKGELGEDWTETAVGLNQERIIKDLGPWYQYVTSYHWGLAQITLGAHDINPINSNERIFTIACNLFGLLFGGTLIAILSNTLIDLKEMNQDRATKLRILKEFLMQHKVDISVRMRVLRQVQDRVKQRETILVEKDVQALDLLSHGLLRELRWSLFAPHVLSHTAFRAWTCIGDECIRSLCGEGTQFLVLLPDDELFKAGIECSAAYHVMSGQVLYKTELASVCAGSATALGVSPATTLSDATHERESLQSANGEILEVVKEGSWLCEATWWCHWHHVGTATTNDPCTLLVVTPKAIIDAMSRHVAVCAITREYARLFHQRIINANMSHLPSDISLHYADFSDLIFAMPAEVHIILGVAALEQVLEKQVPSAKLLSSLASLEAEIREGRSIVLLDKDGCLQRQVALSILRIERDGLILVQVAAYDSQKQKWKAGCKIPGAKQKHGEVPGQAMKRFVEERMDVCSDMVDWHSFTTTSEAQSSASFGIGTTYYKNSFAVDCGDDLYDRLGQYCYNVDVVPSIKRTMTAPSVDFRRSTVPREEDLQSYIADMKQVYLLSGSDSCSIFVWMEEDMIEPFGKHEETLNHWVGSLCELLPDTSDVYFPRAQDRVADALPPASTTFTSGKDEANKSIWSVDV